MSIFNSLGSNYNSESGVYTLFKPSKKSIDQLKNYLQTRYDSSSVELTYKGREAIALILSNLDLPRGSYVAVNGYTCYAVYQAIEAAGLHPYYLDISKNDLNFNSHALEAAFKQPPYITAVMIQNTLGIACDIEAIQKICKQNKAILIEDLAHSIGLIYPNGQEAGTVGLATALSFSQDKMIDAVSGGAALFNSKAQDLNVVEKASARHLLLTRLYPWSTLFIRKTFDAIIGRATLKASRLLRLLPGPMSGAASPAHVLPAWHSQLALNAYQHLYDTIIHRQRIAAIYRDHLPANIQFKHHDSAVYLRFPIQVDEPIKLIEFLKGHHIYLSDRWYDAPIAPKRFLDKTDYKPGDCPNAEYISDRMVNLPTHINVSEAQAHKIVEKVNQWLAL